MNFKCTLDTHDVDTLMALCRLNGNNPARMVKQLIRAHETNPEVLQNRNEFLAEHRGITTKEELRNRYAK